MADEEAGAGLGFDPQALLSQALEMQQKLIDARAEAEAATVTGTAGGGKVTVTMTGGGEVTAVHIDPSVAVAEEVDLLEDLILAALHDGAAKAAEAAQSAMGGFPDLGGLAGLLGGPSPEG